MVLSALGTSALFTEARDVPALVELELPAGGSFTPVGRLVAAGVGARIGLSTEQIEDLRSALDIVLRWTPARDRLLLVMKHTSGSLRVEIGPFSASYAGRRARDGALSRLVEHGTRDIDGARWVILRVTQSPLAAAS